MPKYEVCIEANASSWVTVEANNEHDAVEKVFEGDLPDVCASCAGMFSKQNGFPHTGIDLGDWNEAFDPESGDVMVRLVTEE